MSRPKAELQGLRFGRLLVNSYGGRATSGHHLWTCSCDCGQVKAVKSKDLTRGGTTSCGCFRREVRKTHGLTDSPEYVVWRGMRQRCLDPGSSHFMNYGGRGINVCDRWAKFEHFFSDMGARPNSAFTLERKDNDGSYSPDNCTWTTRKVQALNTRRNHWLTLGGRTQTMLEWSEQLGLSYTTIRARKRRGWSDAATLSTPIKTATR